MPTRICATGDEIQRQFIAGNRESGFTIASGFAIVLFP
jgi:hypothetical protein